MVTPPVRHTPPCGTTATVSPWPGDMPRDIPPAVAESAPPPTPLQGFTPQHPQFLGHRFPAQLLYPLLSPSCVRLSVPQPLARPGALGGHRGGRGRANAAVAVGLRTLSPWPPASAAPGGWPRSGLCPTCPCSCRHPPQGGDMGLGGSEWFRGAGHGSMGLSIILWGWTWFYRAGHGMRV